MSRICYLSPPPPPPRGSLEGTQWLECISCARCVPTPAQLLQIIDIIEAQAGQRPNDWTCGWLEEEIAWTRCRAAIIHREEISAKEQSTGVRAARNERRALEKARNIIRQRFDVVSMELEDKYTTALEVIDREIRLREWVMKQASGHNVMRELRSTDQDVFEHVSLRLNRKHSLEVLVFSSIVIWGIITNDSNPKIGRPPERPGIANADEATPFMRFLLVVAEPLRKSLGITPASLAERARRILGRR